MTEKNRVNFSAFSDPREKIVTRVSRRGFDRNFFLLRESAHIRRARFKIDIVTAGEFFDEPRVRIA